MVVGDNTNNGEEHTVIARSEATRQSLKKMIKRDSLDNARNDTLKLG
jgi:hypothetical protein